jgi:hypothetical protein
VLVALALTWLPYMSMRCVDSPGGEECWMSSHHSEGHGSGEAHKGYHPAPGTTEPSPPHDHGSGRDEGCTCCELTGKCNIKITSATPQVDPVQLAATLPGPAVPVVPDVPALPPRSTPAVAHAPPIYLRNVTFLI